MSNVITRFAPSPTGPFHIGALRTALFNFAFAKQHGGKMILRIEDTDQVRSEKRFEEDIITGLQWIGIAYEGPYWQSERKDIYKKYIMQLVYKSYAYVSKEERGEVIRFKNPSKKVRLKDRIRGFIEMETGDLGDFVIAKDIETPLYHLAVVIDDHEMGVTHVIRGEDHISNTPRQLLIQNALGFNEPEYTHLPLVLAPDKSKLSKRHGAKSVNQYREDGYLKDALVNFVALFGWSPQAKKGSTSSEIFTMDEFIHLFSIDKIQKGGGVFNEDKLKWINREHLKKLTLEELQKELGVYMPEELTNLPQYSPERFKKIVPILLQHIEKLSDISRMYNNGELAYFFKKPDYTPEKLVLKNDEMTSKDTRAHLENLCELLNCLTDDEFSVDGVKKTIWEYATKKGRGAVLWPMRYALSGKDKSPDPFVIASILGKKETLARIKEAIKLL